MENLLNSYPLGSKNIETFISEFGNKMCNHISLIAKRMDYDLGTCCLFNFCEAKDYHSQWDDNLKQRFQNLKSFYLVSEDSTISQLENAIKIKFESYKLNNPNWYISTEYSKSLSNLFKNI